MKKFLVLTLALVFTSPAGWAGSNNHRVYNASEQIYDNVIYGDHEESDVEEEVDSFVNSVTVNDGIFNDDIIGGKSEHGDAYQNELHINGGTFNSASDLKAGYSHSGDATENLVRLNGVTLQGSVTAGEGAVNATDNELIISNSTVNYNTSAANQVIAGKGYSGEVTNNNLNITSNSVVDTTAAAGYSDGGAAVSYNTVTVSGGSRLGNTSGSRLGNTSGSSAVYGGYAAEGDSFHNQITLEDAGTVASDLYGGYSDTGAAEYNLVLVEQSGDISGAVYGGYTASGTQAYENEVRLNGGQASGIVAGGWAEGEGDAVDNSVTVGADAVLGSAASVYGGYAAQGEVSGNTVTMASASAGEEAYGGYAAAGTASDNSLSVSGATSGGHTLAGGHAEAGTASNNTLTISNSTLAGGNLFYGAYGATGVSGNRLNVSASTLTGSLYGGWAHSGAASGNSVSVSGGKVTGVVYGGYTNEGEASGNTVELNNVEVTGDVYGGYAASAPASAEDPNTPADIVTNNNTVILSGNTTISGVLSGGNGNVTEGNSLLLRNYTGTLGDLSTFDNVTIYGLNSSVKFKEDVAGGINVQLYGRPSEELQTIATTPGNTELRLSSNILGAYSYTLENAAGGSGQSWSVRGHYENDLAKPYAQAQLAGLTLATLGDDMLADAFDEAVKLKTDNDSFGGVQYYDNSYDTGSGFDMQSLAVQFGHWYKPGEAVWGWFAQYAHGHYSTDPKDATGDIDTFGVGAFGLLPYSDEGHLEAVLRAGYQTGDFNSDELSSNLDKDGFYGGLSAGIVQNVSLLQFYGKVNWLYLAGDNVHDNLDQHIDFDAVQSLTGKVGAKLNFGTLANKYKPYIGVAGIYELDGDSNVSVDGHKVSDAELQGLTGQAEIGVTYENYNAMLPMKSSLSVFGLTGQTEGWGANVRLAFSF